VAGDPVSGLNIGRQQSFAMNYRDNDDDVSTYLVNDSIAMGGSFAYRIII